ncbi:MAG: MOSC domain protein, partial [uncultured Rubrobacteraceae bacterium]
GRQGRGDLRHRGGQLGDGERARSGDRGGVRHQGRPLLRGHGLLDAVRGRLPGDPHRGGAPRRDRGAGPRHKVRPAPPQHRHPRRHARGPAGQEVQGRGGRPRVRQVEAPLQARPGPERAGHDPGAQEPRRHLRQGGTGRPHPARGYHRTGV